MAERIEQVQRAFTAYTVERNHVVNEDI